MGIRNVTLYCFLTVEIIVADNMQTSVGSLIHDESGDIVWCLHGFPEYPQATVGIISWL
jgi:hypothetical protein